MKLALLCLAGAACYPGPSPADLVSYNAQQQACVADAGSRAQADSCRASSRAALCAEYPALSACKDGGP